MNNCTLPESSASFLTALFKNPLNAENIYKDLLSKGYREEDITLIMSPETQRKYFAEEGVIKNNASNRAFEGMGIGGAVGGTMGAIAAAIASAGAVLTIPGLGIVAIGSLAASLAGAGAGAAAGGLIGALIGAGLPVADVKKYEKGIKEGGVIIGVTPLSSQDYNLLRDEWNTSYE